MPAEQESTYPADWIRIAANDFQRVSRRLEEGDIADAALHLQQALEKYLKGFLLSRGWALQRTHDLRILLEEAARYEPDLKRFRRLCAEITAYYVQERYPFFGTEPSLEEVEENFRQARSLVERIEGFMRK